MSDFLLYFLSILLNSTSIRSSHLGSVQKYVLLFFLI
jgi:hypothetical protein